MAKNPNCPTLEDADGNEIKYPTKRIVCERCNGDGVHDHPAFSNGISREEMDEDPDFREDYLRGRYDVRCEECKGRNVVDVPDEDRIDPATLKLLHDYWQEEASYRQMCRMEQMMGC